MNLRQHSTYEKKTRNWYCPRIFWLLRYYQQQIYFLIYPLLPGGSSSPLPDPVWAQERINSFECLSSLSLWNSSLNLVHILWNLFLEISFPVSLSKTVVIVFHVFIFFEYEGAVPILQQADELSFFLFFYNIKKDIFHSAFSFSDQDQTCWAILDLNPDLEQSFGFE